MGVVGLKPNETRRAKGGLFYVKILSFLKVAIQ